MRLRYLIIQVQTEQEGEKQLPVLFSHGWSDEQIKAAVEAISPSPVVVSEGQARFISNTIVSCEGYPTSLFRGKCRGRHDEILLESAEYL